MKKQTLMIPQYIHNGSLIELRTPIYQCPSGSMAYVYNITDEFIHFVTEQGVPLACSITDAQNYFRFLQRTDYEYLYKKRQFESDLKNGYFKILLRSFKRLVEAN